MKGGMWLAAALLVGYLLYVLEQQGSPVVALLGYGALGYLFGRLSKGGEQANG